MTDSGTKRVQPNFIVIGAAKCGTTTLHARLSEHPDIFMCEPKEPSYFLQPWPMANLPLTEAEYLALFVAGEGRRAIGEASANYLFVPDTARRMHELLGDDLKLVVMLRHPVNMMYSLWEHASHGNWEDRPSSEALLASSIDEPLIPREQDPFWTTWYCRRANYAAQIEAYLEYFPRENLKVFIFEEFYAPGCPLFPELFKFLGVDERFAPSGITLNAGMKLGSRGLNHFFHSTYPEYIFPVIKHVVPHAVRWRVKARLVRLAKWRSSRRSAPVRREMERRLNDSVRRLEALLGRDLSKVWF